MINELSLGLLILDLVPLKGGFTRDYKTSGNFQTKEILEKRWRLKTSRMAKLSRRSTNNVGGTILTELGVDFSNTLVYSQRGIPWQYLYNMRLCRSPPGFIAKLKACLTSAPYWSLWGHEQHYWQFITCDEWFQTASNKTCQDFFRTRLG